MAPSGKGHRWYLGGVASAGAACVTHPLDLLKVRTAANLYKIRRLVESSMSLDLHIPWYIKVILE